MIKYNYIIFFILVSTFSSIYFYKQIDKDSIVDIDSNLENYRIIPIDKGGLPQYNLEIYNEL